VGSGLHPTGGMDEKSFEDGSFGRQPGLCFSRHAEPGEVARFSDYMARWVGTGRSLFIQKSHDTQGMASQAVVSSGRAFLGSLRAA
jgi:hypothetical protein